MLAGCVLHYCTGDVFQTHEKGGKVMNRKHVVFAVLFFVLALIGIGCSKDNPLSPDETIIFENRTGINAVSCYIDNELKGTVDNGKDLKVEGDYQGDRVLRVNSGSTVLATRNQHIDSAMTFIWTLTN